MSLRTAVERLEATYQQARTDLVRGIDRYILLDALTAIVQAHTALTTAQPDQGG